MLSTILKFRKKTKRANNSNLTPKSRNSLNRRWSQLRIAYNQENKKEWPASHRWEKPLSILVYRSSHKYKIFVCGPPFMMESILKFCRQHKISCDVALETIMACGFGICQGCTVEFNSPQSKNHSYREKYGLVCCDGPIFKSSEIKTCLV